MEISILKGVSAFSNFVLAGLLPALILIGIVVAITLAMHTSGEKDKDDIPTDEGEEPIVPSVVGARVTKMWAEPGLSIVQNKKQYVTFTVTFLTSEGETLEFDVPEETYAAIDIGTEGMLVYVDDTFYEFGEGEDVGEDADENSEANQNIDSL